MEIFTVDQLLQLVISAAITTIVVSAVNVFQEKVPGNWLAALVALVVTILRTTFVAGMKFSDWQVVALGILLTWAFSILFWKYLGGKFIDKLFGDVWNRITGGKSEPPTP